MSSSAWKTKPYSSSSSKTIPPNPHTSERSSSKPTPSYQTKSRYLTAQEALILVSPEGVLYMLDESTKSIVWAHETKTTVYHSNNKHTRDFIDLQMNEHGKIDLYHCSSDDNMEIPSQQLKEYFENKFKDNAHISSFQDEFDLDFCTGRIHKNSSSKRLNIKRTAYALSQNSETSIWSLNFSVYEVSDSESSIFRVHHAFRKVDFITFCENRPTFTFSRSALKGVTLKDLSLGYKLKRKKITLDVSQGKTEGTTKMYMGEHDGRAAAIKRISKTDGIAEKFELIMSSNSHDNISRFFGAEVCDNGDMFLAFEEYDVFHAYCKFYSLEVLIGLITDVMHGVTHLHGLGLCHGGLTPWSVLVSGQKFSGQSFFHAKLCGIDKCKRLTENSKDKDFELIGKFMGYTICLKEEGLKTAGLTSLEVFTETAYNDLPAQHMLKRLEVLGEREVLDIVAYLINHGASISLEYILSHPWTWELTKKLHFMRDVYDFLSQHGGFRVKEKRVNNEAPNLKNLIEKETMDFKATGGGTWKNGFPANLVRFMEEDKKEGEDDGKKNVLKKMPYESYTVMGLLRFVRNLISHREEIYKDTGFTFLSDEDLLMKYIGKKFPPLLIRIYNLLQPISYVRAKLKNYLMKSHDD